MNMANFNVFYSNEMILGDYLSTLCNKCTFLLFFFFCAYAMTLIIGDIGAGGGGVIIFFNNLYHNYLFLTNWIILLL